MNNHYEHGRMEIPRARSRHRPKRQAVTVALMDVLGQEGDPDVPGKLLELQYSSGRYFTLIYSATGALQLERATRYSEATVDTKFSRVSN